MSDQQTVTPAPLEQETVTREREAAGFSAAIAAVDPGTFRVELTRTTLAATVEQGQEGRRIDMRESEEQAVFTVLLPETYYTEMVATPWERIIQQLHMEPITVPELDDAFTVTSTPELSSPSPLLPTRVTPAPVAGAGPRPGTAYERERFEVEEVPPPVTEQEPVQGEPFIPGSHFDVKPVDPVPTLPLERQDDRQIYVAREDATVMDLLLGQDGVTVVRQPYYSPHAFEKEEETREAGWQQDYWFVQFKDLDVRKTEFSYNGGLAMDGIDAVTLSPGDTVTVDASEEYTCGAYTPDEEVIDAWNDRYRWFDDDLARGVYAAMVEGNEFYGAPLDLSGLEAVRDAYRADYGVEPEAVFDNVTYNA